MVRPPHIEEFITLAGARQVLDLPLQYLPVLASLVAHPGATLTEMCELVGLDMDGMSRMLKTLRTSYKVLDFEADREDGRKKHFYLTKFGREQAVKWLKARNIPLTEEQAESIPVIVPVRNQQSRVRRGPTG